MNSVPRIGTGSNRLTTIPGAVPKLGAFPSGCRFHPRCPLAQPVCAAEPPALLGVDGRFVRCPFWERPIPDPQPRATPLPTSALRA